MFEAVEFISTSLADVPMLRFIVCIIFPIAVMACIPFARLAAIDAQTCHTGNPMRFSGYLLAAILAALPVLRFSGLPYIAMPAFLAHCAGAASNRQQAGKQQCGQNPLFHCCAYIHGILSLFVFSKEGAPPKSGRRRPARRCVIAASRPSR